jgi:hypothetical protein
MPADSIYLPVHVGAEGKLDDKGQPLDLGYDKDNTGDNISIKNKNYCELTGLYWAWKNLDAEYIGLVHYRRQFAMRRWTKDRRYILSGEQISALLDECDVLLPVKRNYWIETSYSQYAHAHHAADLDITREIIAERHPEYISAYDAAMKLTTGHRFNMLIMKRDILDSYCTWLFGILFELEKRLDISDYSDNDKRVFGFVAERLMDVWLTTNKIRFKDIPYIFLENENWLRKGTRFVLRKIIKKSLDV